MYEEPNGYCDLKLFLFC